MKKRGNNYRGRLTSAVVALAFILSSLAYVVPVSAAPDEIFENFKLLVVRNDGGPQNHGYLVQNEVDFDEIYTDDFAEASAEFFTQYDAVIYEPGNYNIYDDLRSGLPALSEAMEEKRIIVSLRVAGNMGLQNNIDFLGTSFINDNEENTTYGEYADIVDPAHRFISGQDTGGVQLTAGNFETWNSTFHGWLDDTPDGQAGYTVVLSSELGPVWIEYRYLKGWVLVDGLTAIQGGWGSGNAAVADNYIRYLAYMYHNLALEDVDGIPPEIEDAAPNNGDGNGDGTLDSEQANVASFVNPINNQYITLALSRECSITSVSVSEESDNGTADQAFSYDSGFVNFTADCGENGFTTAVNLYYYGITAEDALVRKYNPNTKTYLTVDGASLSNQTIGEDTAVVAGYSITDGGELDVDGQLNGIIVDPVGLGVLAANAQDGSLADTGQSYMVALGAMLLMLAGGAVLHRLVNTAP